MSLSEFELIARLAPYLATTGDGILVGHGDDAAVLDLGGRAACVATDVIVADRHFSLELSALDDVGWKAIAVNVSDLAAMGAQPLAAVSGLCRPADLAADDVEAIYAGMAEAATRYGLHVVGGDTVAADQLSIAVTAVGAVDPARVVRRSGAARGDRLVLVGELGAAAAALAQWQAGEVPDARLLSSHRRPQALVDAGALLAEHGATAMIDVSDGLGADLAHLCEASGVAARIDAAALPIAPGVAEAADQLGLDTWDLACGGGEDFALLATMPADRAEQAAASAGDAEGVPAAVIGRVVAYRGGEPSTVLVVDGGERRMDHLGYDHYPAAPGG